MSKTFQHCDHLIVGAGPGGMAAAQAASKSGQSVILLDENPQPGGQIWRGGAEKQSSPLAQTWFRNLLDLPITRLQQTRLLCQMEPGVLRAEAPEGTQDIAFQNLILATGARERFLPFPGWTLPGVMGAGGLQALVKSGWEISGKRVIIAGTGPLLLAVAQFLKRQGAQVLCVAEQASKQQILLLGMMVLQHPEKWGQSIELAQSIWNIPKYFNSWPICAEGQDQIERVTLKHGQRTTQIDCDYLACGFDLVPNLEVGALLSCEIKNGFFQVDDYQQTSVSNVYAVGELTGIGGVEKALTEGMIAGYAATGDKSEAQRLFSKRNKYRQWTQMLQETFQLRKELKYLAEQNTIICRCEDVTYQQISSLSSWREAKLQTRCGMGPCQGRVCGPITHQLFGWEAHSSRPPVFPAPLKNFSQNVNNNDFS